MGGVDGYDQPERGKRVSGKENTVEADRERSSNRLHSHSVFKSKVDCYNFVQI